MNDAEGTAAEVYADLDTKEVITRFLHPDTGDLILEVHLDPETAREYAFSLTNASYAIDDDVEPQ